ncbi:MAG: DUF1566 domain-containing protein [Treponema sp.]|jgi:hypothetical protein|nr:DUF1566 domain-containing protein [Treponema sp.]
MIKAYYYGVLPFVFLLCSCVLESGVPGPAGGYVFYDKGAYSDGWRYLECAPENAGEEVNWNRAKTLCEDYSFGGYDDWHLPLRKELKWMWDNLHKKRMGNFDRSSGYDEDCYWSSEEYNEYEAYYFNFGKDMFSGGDEGHQSKGSSYYDRYGGHGDHDHYFHARPVRKF